MKFLPERWLPDAERFKDDQKLVFQPFSFGPRNCLGKKWVLSSWILRRFSNISSSLAYHEMRLIISSILFEFDISLVDNEDNWLDQKNYVCKGVDWYIWDTGNPGASRWWLWYFMVVWHSPNQFWPDGRVHDSASLLLLGIIQPSICIAYTQIFGAFTFRM